MLATPDLFGSRQVAPAAPEGGPLAARLRPHVLGDVVGQDHLLGPAGAISRMPARGSLAFLVLWGPLGIGKTTVARLLAAAAGLHFIQLSAVFSGVADLKRTFEEARCRRAAGQSARLEHWAELRRAQQA